MRLKRSALYTSALLALAAAVAIACSAEAMAPVGSAPDPAILQRVSHH
jgi:hypothetical protein